MMATAAIRILRRFSFVCRPNDEHSPLYVRVAVHILQDLSYTPWRTYLKQQKIGARVRLFISLALNVLPSTFSLAFFFYCPHSLGFSLRQNELHFVVVQTTSNSTPTGKHQSKRSYKVKQRPRMISSNRVVLHSTWDSQGSGCSRLLSARSCSYRRYPLAGFIRQINKE